MDPNTMTLDECRDWLACEDGWAFVPHVGWRKHELGDHPADVQKCDDHPIPATLDDAARALPDGWTWYYVGWASESVEATAKNNDARICKTEADTELLARFRLAVAVRYRLEQRPASPRSSPRSRP